MLVSNWPSCPCNWTSCCCNLPDGGAPCRKQAWLWMQGDLYRAKQKERMRSERPDYSGILIAVDDMCINDMDNCDRCN